MRPRGLPRHRPVRQPRPLFPRQGRRRGCSCSTRRTMLDFDGNYTAWMQKRAGMAAAAGAAAAQKKKPRPRRPPFPPGREQVYARTTPTPGPSASSRSSSWSSRSPKPRSPLPTASRTLPTRSFNVTPSAASNLPPTTTLSARSSKTSKLNISPAKSDRSPVGCHYPGGGQGFASEDHRARTAFAHVRTDGSRFAAPVGAAAARQRRRILFGMAISNSGLTPNPPSVMSCQACRLRLPGGSF